MHEICKGHSINKGNVFEKKKKIFFRFFSINVNSALFGIGLLQKLF